jgi:hypothetical protein
MINGIKLRLPSLKLLTNLVDLGLSIQEMELSMDQRSILKFTMHFAVNINAVQFSVISNFQSDSIFNTRLKVLLKSNHTLLSIKQQKISKRFKAKSSSQMTWTILISLGVNTD